MHAVVVRADTNPIANCAHDCAARGGPAPRQAAADTVAAPAGERGVVSRSADGRRRPAGRRDLRRDAPRPRAGRRKCNGNVAETTRTGTTAVATSCNSYSENFRSG